MNTHQYSKLAVILVAGLLLTLLTGVFAIGAQGSELRVAVPAPENLDPSLGSNDSEILLNRSIYDYLIDIAPDGSLVSNLATSWDISEDGQTYTFQLAEGVTFHDGSAFSSADVVFTFNRLTEVGSPATNLLGEYEVATDGDNTVVFTLPGPNADFLFGVASRWAFVLQDGTAEPNVLGEGDAAYANFNGTGAFVLTDFSPGESATLSANESYWVDGQPAVDTVTLVFIEDQQAQIDALKSDGVDIIFKVPFDRVEELDGEDGMNVTVKPTNQHPVIRIRSDEGFIGSDARVLQAFKHATDRELLNIDLFDGRAIVGNNDPIGPLYGPFFDDTIATQEPDPARACELLAEAGFPDGLGADEPLTFYVADAFNYEDMAIAIQEQWAEGCINVDILMRPENVYYGDNEWMEVEIGVTGWGSRPIPQQYLVEAYVSGGIYNESHWADAEFDDLVAQASVTAAIEDRAGIYSQISQIFADRGPIIVPFFAPIVGASSDGVEGFDMHPFVGRTDLRTISVSG